MRTRRIGSLEVSLVGLGCNNFGGRCDEAQSRAVVEAALDAGVTFFDTADIYGGSLSEEFLGRALGSRREGVVVATKFGMEVGPGLQGAAPEYVARALDASLRRLGTDYVDLYQLHRPDPTVPIADTLGALGELVKAGKVRELGCSNFSVAQLEEAARVAGEARFVSVQNEYSLLHRDPEQGVLAECERQGIAFLPYFPLKAGLLSGKYRHGEALPEGTRLAGMPAERRQEFMTSSSMESVELLRSFAEERGHSLLELAIAWLASKPVVASVIAGATRPEQVTANAKAAAWEMSLEEVCAVQALVPAPASA